MSKNTTFVNQRLYKGDFAGQDLARADFRSSTLCEANFQGTNLRFARFDGANCYGANFDGADLYKTNFHQTVLAKCIFKPKEAFGVGFSMSCDTFENMQMSDIWFRKLLFLISQINPDDMELKQKLIECVIGIENYEAFQRTLKRRVV